MAPTTSVGYDGTVDEVQWASLAPRVGRGRYGVISPGDWKVTPHPSTAQAVNVAAGTGWGHGVLDVTTDIQTVQCSPISSGTRWDLITMNRDWTPPNGSTAAGKVTGGSTKQIPPRDATPGVKDAQPLALVQWTAGQTQPTAIIDLRCWSGPGGIIAKDQLALTFLDDIGAHVTIGDVVWDRVLGPNDVPTWANQATGTTTAFVDNLGNYDFSGPVTVKRLSPTQREVTVSVVMIRRNEDNPMSPKAQDMGVVLPAIAQGSGNSVVQASPLDNGVGGNSSSAAVYWHLQPSSGKLLIWSPTNFTWNPGRFISINCTYTVTV